MTKQTDTAFSGYYLENRKPNGNNKSGRSAKFYTVLIGEDGTIITNWGAISTVGQHKVDKVSSITAFDLGMRQVYSKKSRGYDPVTEDIKIMVQPRTLQDAQAGNPTALIHQFNQARRDPSFAGEQTLVLRHYSDFATKAQLLLADATSLTLDEVIDRHEGLKQAWADLQDKHDEVKTILDLTGQAVARKIMGA